LSGTEFNDVLAKGKADCYTAAAQCDDSETCRSEAASNCAALYGGGGTEKKAEIELAALRISSDEYADCIAGDTAEDHDKCDAAAKEAFLHAGGSKEHWEWERPHVHQLADARTLGALTQIARVAAVTAEFTFLESCNKLNGSAAETDLIMKVEANTKQHTSTDAFVKKKALITDAKDANKCHASYIISLPGKNDTHCKSVATKLSQMTLQTSQAVSSGGRRTLTASETYAAQQQSECPSANGTANCDASMYMMPPTTAPTAAPIGI